MQQKGKADMKFRKGFVTNSSSSSYVIVIKEDAYDVAMQNVHPLVRKVLEAELGTPRHNSFNDESVLVIHCEVSDEDMGYGVDKSQIEELSTEPVLLDAEQSFVDALVKYPDDTAEVTIDILTYMTKRFEEFGALVDVEGR